MAKTRTRTLIIFWVIALPLLVLWHVALQVSNDPAKLVSAAHTAAQVLPLGDKNGTAIELANYALQKDGRERTFLLLLQNNLELRPGGGYIGSFAIVKIRNGSVTKHEVHNTNVFDGRVPHDLKPPYPMAETLNIPSWQMRDSNFTPDFRANAELAEGMYHLGGGQEQFDGIISVNATLLEDVLAITGPVQLANYPGVYKSGSAIVQLEYQVEKGWVEQEITMGERKAILTDLAGVIIARISALPLRDKIELAKSFVTHFDGKDVQFFMRDQRMHALVSSVGWDGRVDQVWEKDYLMIVDANLAALKSDYFVKRSVDYDVDLSGSIPQGIARIHYEHTAQRRDWMTKDYQTYLRVYAPENAWFVSQTNNVTKPVYGNEFGKKFIGFLVHVPIGSEKTVEVRYNLPREFKNHQPYDLKVQKQSGVGKIPITVQVTQGNGVKESFTFTMNNDTVLSEI